jgi:RNA polymerase sigma-70 factor (ECF subfamily)
MGAAAHDDDTELVRAIAGGVDARQAEAALYARYQRRAYLYGIKHLKDPDAAWDLTQEALSVLMTKIRAGELREPDRLGSFLLGTCRLLVASERRTEGRRKKLLLQYAEPSEPTTSAPVERFDLERVTGCLGRLSDREQTVLLLSYYAELDAGAIALELGLSAGHVRVLRHRAFERLRVCVQPGEKVAS